MSSNEDSALNNKVFPNISNEDSALNKKVFPNIWVVL